MSVLWAIAPALVAVAVSFVPGIPSGVLLGAAIALPLLAVGAIITAITARLAIGPATAGVVAAGTIRLIGAVVAAVLIRSHVDAKIALATLVGCLFVGLSVEVALWMRHGGLIGRPGEPAHG